MKRPCCRDAQFFICVSEDCGARGGRGRCTDCSQREPCARFAPPRHAHQPSKPLSTPWTTGQVRVGGRTSKCQHTALLFVANVQRKRSCLAQHRQPPDIATGQVFSAQTRLHTVLQPVAPQCRVGKGHCRALQGVRIRACASAPAHSAFDHCHLRVPLHRAYLKRLSRNTNVHSNEEVHAGFQAVLHQAREAFRAEARADVTQWFYADASAPSGWNGPHTPADLAVVLLAGWSMCDGHWGNGEPVCNLTCLVACCTCSGRLRISLQAL